MMKPTRLTYPTSLELIRLSRTPLAPIQMKEIDVAPDWPKSARRPETSQLLLAREGDPWYPGTADRARVLVATDRDRRRNPSGAEVVCEANLPYGSFRLVERHGFDDVVVESPQLTVVRAAAELKRLQVPRAMGDREATLRLVSLVDELCGRYSRSPVPGWDAGAASDVEPVMSLDQLREYLDEARGIDGLPLARAAARLALDNLGSPMEAVVELLLCAPPRFGGLGLPRPISNEPLVFDARERQVVLHGQLRPDLYWPAWNLAIEYNGSSHATLSSSTEDDRRILDYQACGIRVLPIRSAILFNEAELDKVIHTVVTRASETEGRRLKSRLLKRLESETFRDRRRLLLVSLGMRQR